MKYRLVFLAMLLAIGLAAVSATHSFSGGNGQPQRATHTVVLPEEAADRDGWLTNGDFWVWSERGGGFKVVGMAGHPGDRPPTNLDGPPYPTQADVFSPNARWEAGHLWTPQGQRPCLVSLPNQRVILYPRTDHVLAQWWSSNSRGLYSVMLDRRRHLTERLIEAQPPRGGGTRVLWRLQPKARVYNLAGPITDRTVTLPAGTTLGPFVGRTPDGRLLFEQAAGLLPMRLIIVSPADKSVAVRTVSPQGVPVETPVNFITDYGENSARSCNNNVSLTLSPDGRHLAWLIAVPGRPGTAEAGWSAMRLIVSDIDGGHARELDRFVNDDDAEFWLAGADFSNPISWTPDGRISLRHSGEPNCEYVYDVSGTADRHASGSRT